MLVLFFLPLYNSAFVFSGLNDGPWHPRPAGGPGRPGLGGLLWILLGVRHQHPTERSGTDWVHKGRLSYRQMNTGTNRSHLQRTGHHFVCWSVRLLQMAPCPQTAATASWPRLCRDTPAGWYVCSANLKLRITKWTGCLDTDCIWLTLQWTPP